MAEEISCNSVRKSKDSLNAAGITDEVALARGNHEGSNLDLALYNPCVGSTRSFQDCQAFAIR